MFPFFILLLFITTILFLGNWYMMLCIMSMMTVWFMMYIENITKSLVFFFIQEFSFIFIMLSVMDNLQNMILFFIFVKMGMPPFHTWIIPIIEMMNITVFLSLITYLKFIPGLFLISKCNFNIFMLSLFLIMSVMFIMFCENSKMFVYLSSSMIFILLKLMSNMDFHYSIISMVTYIMTLYMLFFFFKYFKKNMTSYTLANSNIPIFISFLFKFMGGMYLYNNMIMIMIFFCFIVSSFMYMKVMIENLDSEEFFLNILFMLTTCYFY